MRKELEQELFERWPTGFAEAQEERRCLTGLGSLRQFVSSRAGLLTFEHQGAQNLSGSNFVMCL
jgi:hypothetical protein